jgi:hypothetical protein
LALQILRDDLGVFCSGSQEKILERGEEGVGPGLIDRGIGGLAKIGGIQNEVKENRVWPHRDPAG